MGTREERGAGKEERGGAGRDLSTQGQKEEPGVGVGGCGEIRQTLQHIYLKKLIVDDSMESFCYFPVSQGNKHKQISDRLRDAQSKRRIQKAEVDLVNQKRDARIAEINTLQLQFEVREYSFL